MPKDDTAWHSQQQFPKQQWEYYIFFVLLTPSVHAIIHGMCLYLLYGNSYKFDFPNSQISTKPCQRLLVPVLYSGLAVCLLCLIGLQCLPAPVNNNSQLAEWKQRWNVPEWPERASCFQDNIVFSRVMADSLGMLQCGWVAHSRSTDQCPRYRLAVWLLQVVRKSIFSYFVTQVCDVERKKGWFILKAL